MPEVPFVALTDSLYSKYCEERPEMTRDEFKSVPKSSIAYFESIDKHIPRHENSDSVENKNENDHIVPAVQLVRDGSIR